MKLKKEGVKDTGRPAGKYILPISIYTLVQNVTQIYELRVRKFLTQNLYCLLVPSGIQGVGSKHISVDACIHVDTHVC